jgi:CRISPR system Cascade subunit CasC
VTFLDVHVLQTVPPSNLNRDDSGSPKTATYGGTLRARVSSQAWKRAVRLAFTADPLMTREAGRRTKKVPQVIADSLISSCPALTATADIIGLKSAAAMFKIKAAMPKKAKDGDPVGRPVTEYLLFLGDSQLDRVTGVLAGAEQELAGAGSDEKEIETVVGGLGLDRLGITGHPGAVALFGRMIADSPDTNVDAACQVAHAISTHTIAPEFDYFTAVDDNPDADSKGAGMLGTVEFNSATLYRYATVSVRDLAQNLDGDTERALDLSIAFAKAFITAMPSGKRSTFANNTRPDFVMLTVRDDQPVSLVGAFEKPVRSEDGLVAESCARLLRYRTEQDELYGTPPAAETVIYPVWLADDIRARKATQLPVTSSLSSALADTRSTLAELVKG